MRTAGSRRAWPALAVATAASIAIPLVLVRSPRYREVWFNDGWVMPVLIAHLAAVLTAIAGGAAMVRRRPGNRCGYVAIALGIVFGGWYIAYFSVPQRDWWLYAPGLLVTILRPLLFWLVLAYPIGRLDRVSRRFFRAYVALTGAVYAADALTSGDDSGWPLQVFHPSTWQPIVQSAWWDVGGFVAVVAVLVIVQRRRLRFRGPLASAIARPAWWAAGAATAADLVVITTGPLRNLQSDRDGLTPFGTIVQVIDLGRWGLVVAILATGARRAWPKESASGRGVDMHDDASPQTVREALVHALGDPHADLALVDASGRWVDSAGRPRAEPAAATTRLTRDGVVVGALEHDEVFAAHPAVIEAAVSVVALQLDARRQSAVAEQRERELHHVAREVLDAEDSARRRLERDLHDGAQQALVGVTLQAALAARSHEPDADGAAELADAIDGARDTLLRIAAGRPPALLAERGLDGAIGALVLTAGVPVTVSADACDDLPDTVQRAIWFTASEAMTNALKHARPSRLELSLQRFNGAVTLEVGDDGCGGVESAPVALAARVDEAGGTLAIDSSERGTVVRARVPVVAQ
jgi:signal transduction histidine kinase